MRALNVEMLLWKLFVHAVGKMRNAVNESFGSNEGVKSHTNK